jgi:hypothetical protein
MHVVRAGAAAALVALAGCGGSDESSEPTPQPTPAVQADHRGILATIDRLQAAGRSGDGDAICGEVFTRRLAGSVAGAAGRPCAAEVRRTLSSPDLAISLERDVQVTGTRATAVIREQNGDVSALTLVREDDGWRVDRITPR